MTSFRAQRRPRLVASAALLLTLICPLSPVAAAESPPHDLGSLGSVWTWPTDSHRVLVPYRAPATRYGAGHRGIDLSAAVGSPVFAPAAGVVAFAGSVADRPVLTIDHGGGLVSTLEPVRSGLSVGAVVRAAATVGVVGCCWAASRTRCCYRAAREAAPSRQARGCASRYAASSRSPETWV